MFWCAAGRGSVSDDSPGRSAGEGNQYYLNPVDDGTLGMMRTGWQVTDGRSYYFNTQSDGTMGRLYVNTTTPDGYAVGRTGRYSAVGYLFSRRSSIRSPAWGK